MPKGDSIASLREETKTEGLPERFKIGRWSNRNFALYDGEELVCVTVYKRGANEVRRRLRDYERRLVAYEASLNTKEVGDGTSGFAAEARLLPNAASCH